MEELSTLQRRFVSDVSHELRTPLTTIRMAGEVIHASRDDFDPAAKRSAELLQTQLDRFEDLLADLLEISRFDAGAAVLDAEGRDVRDVVDRRPSTTPRRSPSGGARGCTSSCPRSAASRTSTRAASSGSCATSWSTPSSTRRAARSRSRSAPTRTPSRSPCATAASGMTPDEAAHVFDRFWRADPARARTTGGTGLGLAISLEDAHLHGGWLEAWGRPGPRRELPAHAAAPRGDPADRRRPLPLQPDESPITGALRDRRASAHRPRRAARTWAPTTLDDHDAVRRRAAGGPMTARRLRRAVVAPSATRRRPRGAAPRSRPPGRSQEGDAEVTEPSEIDVLAEGPQPGDTPAEIVDGFLAAGAAGFTDNFATRPGVPRGRGQDELGPVRRRPGLRARSSRRPTTTETEVTIDVPVEARVDENGRVRRGAAGRRASPSRSGWSRTTPTSGGSPAPPPGLILQEEDFTRLYRPASLYFLSPDEKFLVPEDALVPEEEPAARRSSASCSPGRRPGCRTRSSRRCPTASSSTPRRCPSTPRAWPTVAPGARARRDPRRP